MSDKLITGLIIAGIVASVVASILHPYGVVAMMAVCLCFLILEWGD